MGESTEYQSPSTFVCQIWDFGPGSAFYLLASCHFHRLEYPKPEMCQVRVSACERWPRNLFPSNRPSSLAPAPEAQRHGCRSAGAAILTTAHIRGSAARNAETLRQRWEALSSRRARATSEHESLLCAWVENQRGKKTKHKFIYHFHKFRK